MPYARGIAVYARWLVVLGTTDFSPGSRNGPTTRYTALAGTAWNSKRRKDSNEAEPRAVARKFVRLAGLRDVVLLDDPQGAALVSAVVDAGALAVRRSHSGHDESNAETEGGSSFLAPYLGKACLRSLAAILRTQVLRNGLSATIPASIDAFSTKNRPMPHESIEEILCGSGMVSSGGNRARPKYSSAREQN